ncbi:MAG: fibronectin type III domain-containing protein [Phycisphaerae bacterium]|nr:fibronectin type III domain-containing protein [Phycisphaerae bacterium]
MMSGTGPDRIETFDTNPGSAWLAVTANTAGGSTAPAAGWSAMGGAGDNGGYIFGNISPTTVSNRLYGLQPATTAAWDNLTGTAMTVDTKLVTGAVTGPTPPAVRFYVGTYTGGYNYFVTTDAFSWNPNGDVDWTTHVVDLLAGNFLEWPNQAAHSKTFDQVIAHPEDIGVFFTGDSGHFANNAWLGLSGAAGTILGLDNFGLAPLSPTALAATTTTTPTGQPAVDLTWTDRSTNEASFMLQRAQNAAFTQDVTTVALLPADTTAYTDATVEPNTTYCYRVFSLNTAGVKSSEAISNPVLTLPAAPTELVATAISSGEISLTWTPGPNSPMNFTVQRWDDTLGESGVWTTMIVGRTTASYIDDNAGEGLDSDTVYTYRVIDTNAAGDSQPSEAALVITAVAPRAFALSSTEVYLTWPVGHNSSLGYTIQRFNPDAAVNDWEIVAEHVDSNEFYDASRTPGQTYVYRVADLHGEVLSPWSLPANATVLLLAEPLNLHASSDATGNILVWDDPATDVGEFLIERSSNQLAWERVGVVSAVPGATHYSMTDAGASDGTVYYRAMAIQYDATGGSSDWVWTYLNTPLNRPSNLMASVTVDHQMVLSWSQRSQSTTEFMIERSINEGGWESIGTVPYSAEHAVFGFTDPLDASGLTVDYRVTAQAPATQPATSQPARADGQGEVVNIAVDVWIYQTTLLSTNAKTLAEGDAATDRADRFTQSTTHTLGVAVTGTTVKEIRAAIDTALQKYRSSASLPVKFTIANVHIIGHRLGPQTGPGFMFGDIGMGLNVENKVTASLKDAAVKGELVALNEALGKPTWQFEHCNVDAIRQDLQAFADIVGHAVVGFKEMVNPNRRFDVPVYLNPNFDPNKRTEPGYVLRVREYLPATSVLINPTPAP